MDGLLILGACFAGAYCWILARRVQALKSLDSGVGGAIVQLTRQIELARTTLEEARSASRETRQDLAELIARSDAAASQLRLLLVASKEPLARTRAARPDSDRREAARRPLAETVLQPETAPNPEPDLAPAEPAPTHRRDGPGPRLVSLPLIVAAPSIAAAPPIAAADERHGDSIPKPRRTQSLETLIRARLPAEPAASNAEADLLAALGAIAAGGER